MISIPTPEAWFVLVCKFRDSDITGDARLDESNIEDSWSTRETKEEAHEAFLEAGSDPATHSASWGPVIGSTEWYDVDSEGGWSYGGDCPA